MAEFGNGFVTWCLVAALTALAAAVQARPTANPYLTKPIERSTGVAKPRVNERGVADVRPVTGLTAQAQIIQRQIAEAPAVVVAQPTPEQPGTVAKGVRPLAPSATVLYRPLDARLEKDVHQLLSQQLNWPADDPDKQRRIAVFPGAVQPTVAGRPQMTLKAIASQDAPMSFDPVRRVFEGRIQVGFVELGVDGSERPLTGNFSFQVKGPVIAEPAVARVTRTAPPFQVIRVTSNEPGDEVLLTISSSTNPGGVQLRMQVVRPQVELRITPPTIQGFGLEVADIVVSSKAPQATRGQRIQLTSDGGRIEPLTVVFDDSGIATASIRSVSVGPATVRAEGAVLGADARASVNFVTPWSFIFAALAGGLAGGVLRKGTQWRTGRKRLALEMLVAVLTGVVVFGLFALGVNVLGVKLPTHGGEVLVFVVSALGAFIGTRLFGGDSTPVRTKNR